MTTEKHDAAQPWPGSCLGVLAPRADDLVGTEDANLGMDDRQGTRLAASRPRLDIRIIDPGPDRWLLILLITTSASAAGRRQLYD